MTAKDKFHPAAQRYLDGDAAEGVSAEDIDLADRFVKALHEYGSKVDIPDARVDTAVMQAIQARGSVERSSSFWQWLLQPSQLRVRPAVLAAASIALIALGAAVPFLLPGGIDPGGNGVATVLVRFELRAPSAASVTLTGSFNAWSADRIALKQSPETGVWSGTVPLQPGRHEYSFVIDGETWVPDPSAHAQVDDGFGQVNSVIVVGPRGVVRS
jgi:hypothetical protein